MLLHRIVLSAFLALWLSGSLFAQTSGQLPNGDEFTVEDSWSEDYTEISSCRAGQAKTRYPILLVHGFMGFDEVLFVDYFYRIRADYQKDCIQVFTPSVSPLDYISVRAKQLAVHVDEILELTGAAKVNIIAHSMGGLDARYLISTMGYADKVASLTTVGTPHRGSPVPDYVWRVLGKDDNVLYKAFEYLVGGIIAGGQKQDLQAALWNLSPTYIDGNRANPNDPRVYYQSYAGVTSITGLSGDNIDPLLLPFAPAFVGKGKNDGRCDRFSKMGTVSRASC